MTKRVSLGPELKHRFAERGFSMSRVAKELGLYENSLRSWIRRNRFPERELILLASFAGLGKALGVLEEAFSFEVSGVRRTHARQLSHLLSAKSVSFDEATGIIDARLLENLKSKGTSAGELQLLFRSLGSGGCYACAFFDQFPEELTVSKWAVVGKDFSSAFEQGAHFIYLYPNASLIWQLRAQGITRVLDAVTVQEHFKALRDRLATSRSRLSAAELDLRIVMVACDTGCFLSPGHRYLFFRPEEQVDGTPRLYLTATVEAGSMAASPLQPLSNDTMNEFLSYLASILARAGQTEVANNLLA